MTIKKQYVVSFILLFLAVGIGAFGAHALKDIVTGKYLITFKTGSQYHFYHALALFMIALLNDKYQNSFKRSYTLILIGLIIFSLNCYLYSVLQAKIFGMIVPIGGVLMLLGWLSLIIKFIKKEI